MGQDALPEAETTLLKTSRHSTTTCPYYPFCPLGDDECVAKAPFLHDIGGGHVVSCHKVVTGK